VRVIHNQLIALQRRQRRKYHIAVDSPLFGFDVRRVHVDLALLTSEYASDNLMEVAVSAYTPAVDDNIGSNAFEYLLY
jgi:hypothetical protein